MNWKKGLIGLTGVLMLSDVANACRIGENGVSACAHNAPSIKAISFKGLVDSAYARSASPMVRLPDSPSSDVTIQGFAFSPASLTVPVGTTVRWTNKDGAPHSSTSQTGPGTITPSGVWDSGNLNFNDQYSFTFTQPGTYDYFCLPHGTSMQGQIVVVVPEPAGASLLVLTAVGGLLRIRRRSQAIA